MVTLRGVPLRILETECLLILGSVCRKFCKAHGRYSSGEAYAPEGNFYSSPGRSGLFTAPWISNSPHSAQTHSTHFSTGWLAIFASVASTEHGRSGPTRARHNGPLSFRRRHHPKLSGRLTRNRADFCTKSTTRFVSAPR